MRFWRVEIFCENWKICSTRVLRLVYTTGTQAQWGAGEMEMGSMTIKDDGAVVITNRSDAVKAAKHFRVQADSTDLFVQRAVDLLAKHKEIHCCMESPFGVAFREAPRA